MEANRVKEGILLSDIFKIKGDWSKQSNALKVNYPKLTNEDVNYEEGKEADLFNRLENRLGINRNEVIGILKTNQEKVF